MRIQRFAKSLIFLAGFLGCGPAGAGTIAFVYSATNQFGVVNLLSGEYTDIGSPDVLLSSIGSISGGRIYGVDNSYNLATLDRTNAMTQVVGALGAPILSLEGSADLLFGQSTTSLYAIDPLTATATAIGDFGPGFNFDFATGAFDAAGNLFEVAETAGDNATSLYSVDRSTGAATLIGANQALVQTILFQDGILYGFAGTAGSVSGNTVVALNTTTGLATTVTQQDPALSTVLGAGEVSTSIPEPGTASFSVIGLAALFLGAREARRHLSPRND